MFQNYKSSTLISRGSNFDSSARFNLCFHFLSDYFSKMNDDLIFFYGVPRERQLSSQQIGNIAMPIVMDVINSAAQLRRYSSSDTGYYDQTLILARRPFNWSDYYPLIDSRPLVASFRSKVS